MLFSKAFSLYSVKLLSGQEFWILNFEFVFCVLTVFVFIQIFSKDRFSFLDILSDVSNSCNPEEYLFLEGDFNCTEYPTPDRNHLELMCLFFIALSIILVFLNQIILHIANIGFLDPLVHFFSSQMLR